LYIAVTEGTIFVLIPLKEGIRYTRTYSFSVWQKQEDLPREIFQGRGLHETLSLTDKYFAENNYTKFLRRDAGFKLRSMSPKQKSWLDGIESYLVRKGVNFRVKPDWTRGKAQTVLAKYDFIRKNAHFIMRTMGTTDVKRLLGGLEDS
jgi:hypothetical protein